MESRPNKGSTNRPSTPLDTASETMPQLIEAGLEKS